MNLNDLSKVKKSKCKKVGLDQFIYFQVLYKAYTAVFLEKAGFLGKYYTK